MFIEFEFASNAELSVERVTGTFYDFELALLAAASGIRLNMQTKQTGTRQQAKQLSLPLFAMPLLREFFAECLVKHNGSRQIGKAVEIPQKLLGNSVADVEGLDFCI